MESPENTPSLRWRNKEKAGAFQSILGFDISFESILDIIAILIWLALFAFALVYYLLVLPVVYLVASIITLGEVWKMRHKYFVAIPAQQIDTLRGNLRKIVKKKAFIKGLPENIVDEDIRRAFSKLSKVYTIFDFGRILIGLALIVTLGIYIYYWSSSFTGGFIEFARSSGLWIYPVGIFTLGFLLIIIAGLARGLMKIKV